MDEKQLTFKEDEISRMLNHAFDLFREGQFARAEEELEGALRVDFDYPELASSLKSAHYWKEKQEALAHTAEPYERGEFLMAAWRHYLDFVQRIGSTSEKGLYSIKQYVFRTALESYESLADDGSLYEAEILLRIGRCHKELGSYDRAIEHLERANQLKGGVPPVLAELADCYSLVGETRAAKVFFREALFIGPDQVDLSAMESGMIQRLVERLRNVGLAEDLIVEWLPVYGTVFGAFNVKRELRPLEYGKLKQSIYQMETQLQEGDQGREVVLPRLLNHYFWLIDHYASSGEERSKVEEVLARIQRLEPNIYREYTK